VRFESSVRALALAVGAAVCASAAHASPIAVDVHAGTTGFGVQGQYFINPYLSARVTGDWFDYNHSLSSSDINYSGKVKFQTFGLFADLHPFKNGWFVSGGFYQGDRKASLTGVPTANVVINGVSYTPAQIGTVRGDATLSSTAGFVGFGWDGAQHDKKGLHPRVTVGAAFGSPKISLTATGPAANTAAVQSYVAQEQAQAQHDADYLKVYPVVTVGLGYRF
jgi:hypothetical protein